MRIAVGGIHTESSTYNPVLTRIHDFHVLRGDALLTGEQFAMLGAFDVNFAPLLHARALPGGPVAHDTYLALKAELLERLGAAGPVDGVYLAMHGAMHVQGLEDAEGDWIEAVRAQVGREIPIAVSYDLHGNVSPRVIDAIDIFAAYRTAPHIDVAETQTRALAMLVGALKSGERPFIGYCPVPVLLPGERTSTEDEPARSLYAKLPFYDARDGIWDANIMVGYVWADEPRATASTIVTGTHRGAVTQATHDLADAYFAARDAFVFGAQTGTIAECVAAAATATRYPVVLADSGDNPTGGGVGDRADVLRELLRTRTPSAVVAGIADPIATQACFAAGVGAALTLPVGATLSAENSTPVTLTCTVEYLSDTAAPADRQAVVRSGGLRIVLTARRRPFHYLADFAALGIAPEKEQLIVVKSGYLSPDLARLAALNLMALSPGVVDQDIERLPAKRLRRPLYPFDRDIIFTPQVSLSARLKENA
ncbi:M81 family metallopeptidase [Methylovirgula sp. 4M-Z18]|uniref:M81 family metallopeptidase n=1 Tax=Methylovirgula sp. 4M-Z18 TaxID=2293567 RepID=UPI000E2EBF5E|nr:M81 family metallopeptidase [Methylovirgula sp. 4M-Z18]RFB80321.1 M81 family peptidase [Methylovirgula sp. 4M-Z18]